MNRLTKLGALLAATGAISLTSHAQILIQSWDFTATASGLDPTQVAGSVVGGPQFTVGGDGQLTNGSTLHVSPTAALNSQVDITAIAPPAGHDTFRLEYEIGGWDWSNAAGLGQTRRISLGFAGNYGNQSSFLFTAGGSIRMTTTGEIRFTAEGATNDITTPAVGFTAVQTTPIYLRIDTNTTDLTYVTTFSDQADFSNVLFTFGGDIFATRVGPQGQLNMLRIGPLDGDNPDYWNGDWTTINSISLSTIPEPSTYAAIFGGLALLGAFVYRRRVRK